MIAAAAIAVVPLMIAAMALRAADFVRPVSNARMLAALAWGAIGAAAIATVATNLLINHTPFAAPGPTRDAVAAILYAPVIEEGAKLFGIVALLLIPFFQGRTGVPPVLSGAPGQAGRLSYPPLSMSNAIVLGVCVGLGFAMSENARYFVGAFEKAGPGAWKLVAARSVFGAGMHIVASGAAAAVVLIAIQRQATTPERVMYWLAAAIMPWCLHLLWNATILMRQEGFARVPSDAQALLGIEILALAAVFGASVWHQMRSMAPTGT